MGVLGTDNSPMCMISQCLLGKWSHYRAGRDWPGHNILKNIHFHISMHLSLYFINYHIFIYPAKYESLDPGVNECVQEWQSSILVMMSEGVNGLPPQHLCDETYKLQWVKHWSFWQFVLMKSDRYSSFTSYIQIYNKFCNNDKIIDFK